jgi:predicted SnoaL-like aldol condensation-catalyzing enzyme
MDAETAKAIVRRYFEKLLNERDVSVCDELLAPAYVDHDAPSDTPAGPSSTKAFVTRFLDAYPDLHVQVVDIVAEANKVAARIIWQGTQRHTGAPLQQMGIVMLHLNGQGQFMERWSGYTTLTPE